MTADHLRVVDKYKRLMPIAEAYAQRSKYGGTKVGAAIFGADYESLAGGWNGAARGCDADIDERSINRPERLHWAVHSEANAISGAARSGVRLKGSTMLVTHTPCMSCAKLVVQAGIIRVICPLPVGQFAERWHEEFTRTRRLFSECGVELVEY